jgi:S-adenosylmethionine synthetase
LNAAVYEAVRLETQRCADIKQIIEKLNNESSHKSRLAWFDVEIDEAQKEIKRLTSSKQAVFEDYSKKLLSTSEYQFAIEKYSAETEKQKLRLGTAKKEKSEYTANSTPKNKWLIAFTHFMDEKELTIEMAKAIIERVVISERNKVEVVFKFRDEFEAVQKFTGVG